MSVRRGQSQEFLDHRPYVPGDDLRYLDWDAYGRLDALWVKLFQDESDRHVTLLLDSSGSMQGAKLDCAREVAAALGVVALGQGDRVAVAGVDERVSRFAPAQRGRAATPRLFAALEGVGAAGASDAVRAISELPRHRGQGLTLWFTDFLFEAGPEAALNALRARGEQVFCLHMVSPQERRLPWSGDVELVDAESGAVMRLHVDEELQAEYAATHEAWSLEMARGCARAGAGYARLLAETDVETLVFAELRRLGLVAG